MEPLPHQHVIFVVAIAVAAVAAALDWKRGEIPNWLTLGALGAAPLLHVARALAAHEGLESALTEAGFAVVGALACALVPALLYRQGAIGGGDLKLFAALGALLQALRGVEAEMYAFFSAALLAPAALAYQGKLFATLKNSLDIFVNLFLPKARRRAVEETTLSWFRLGPAVLFGVALTAYLNW
jgi:prepilin peptidase CpaA